MFKKKYIRIYLDTTLNFRYKHKPRSWWGYPRKRIINYYGVKILQL